MRTIRTALVAVFAATALLGVGLSTQSAQAAGSSRLTFSPSNPVFDENVGVTGRLSTHPVRPVKLQYRTKKGWKTLQTEQTRAGGEFDFFIAVPRKRTYRFYAPSFTVGSKKYAKVVGRTKTVTPVKQKVTEAYLVNARPCPVLQQDVTVVFRFSPARDSREVVLTKPGGTLSQRQDRDGRVAFQFDAGTVAGTYSLKGTVQAQITGIPDFSSKTLTYTVRPDCNGE